MLLQVIQKIAYPWCQAFLLLREPLSSHCTVRVEMVMQQSYFRCGYNIHSLLLSHAISSCLRKKILLMKKTLHIIELDVLNLTVLQWYIHERGNNSHQIWTVVANSDSSGKCPSPVLPSLSQTDLIEHCTHQLHSYPQYCHFRQGVLLDLSCWRNLYYLPNKITVQLQGICFHLKHCTATV